MSQNQKNLTGKNVILISNPSDRIFENDTSRYFQRNASIGSEFQHLGSGGFGRASSIGNLFKTFTKQQRPIQEPIKVEQTKTQSQKYAQQCLQYQKYHFDDRIKLIIRRMTIKAYQNFREKQSHIFLSFSIQKLLGIIAKKMLLNRFQLLFLEYVFEETKWKYDNECISKYAHQFMSYAQLPQSETMTQATKKLEVYLLYCSFYSKKSLNEFPTQNIYDVYLKSICPRFKAHFQEWTQSSNVSNIKINPKVLNSIFKRLTFYSGRDPQEIQNYSVLVEEIIQISPAYNADKDKDKTGSKKRKLNKIKKQEHIEVKQNESQFLPNQLGDQIQQISPDLNDIPILRNKKQTSYVSNVDGLDPQVYLKETQRMI